MNKKAITISIKIIMITLVLIVITLIVLNLQGRLGDFAPTVIQKLKDITPFV